MSGVPGQGSAYDAELANGVLVLMAEYGFSLTRACEQQGVARASFLRWREADHDGLAARYARARDLLLDRWADEIIDVGDRSPVSSDDVQHARLRVDARKWVLSKLRPEQYGDSSKQTIDLSVKGEDPATVLAARRKAREGGA